MGLTFGGRRFAAVILSARPFAGCSFLDLESSLAESDLQLITAGGVFRVLVFPSTDSLVSRKARDLLACFTAGQASIWLKDTDW